MSEPYTGADFVSMTVGRFPELREYFEYNEGLHHVQMGDFARLTMEAKGAGNWEKYLACVQLADELWKRPDDYLLNAINVSYLEHLDFDGPKGKKAWDLLPPALRKAWQEMQDYLDDLAKRGRPK